MTVRITRDHLNYAATQLFDLVADVEKYPQFLPWFIAARIIRRRDATIWTDMTMGTSLLHKRFITEALLDRPSRIDISCHDTMFEWFEQHWKFEPASKGGTSVEYQVDFQFRSDVLQRLVGASFAPGTAAMMIAFKRRAQELYGPPSSSGKIASQLEL